jgi:DNA-binding protein YbaB
VGEAEDSLLDQRIEQMAAKMAEKAERYQVLRERLTSLTVTERAHNGAIQVTVGQSGLVTAMSVSDDLRGMRPSQIAQELMNCMRRAQAQLASQVEAIMRSTVGDDQESVKAVVDSFHAAFPQQEEESQPSRSRRDNPEGDEFFEQPLGMRPRR